MLISHTGYCLTCLILFCVFVVVDVFSFFRVLFTLRLFRFAFVFYDQIHTHTAPYFTVYLQKHLLLPLKYIKSEINFRQQNRRNAYAVCAELLTGSMDYLRI